jgi:hypothetical protein
MRTVLVVAALLTCPLSQTVAAADLEHRISVTGRIAIDPEGRVTEQSLETPLPEAISEAVQRRIAAWRFEPVKVDERAVVATTRMDLSLRLVEADDQFDLFVDSVHFGSPAPHPNQQRGRGSIRYPSSMLQRRVGGRVVLAVRLDADGSVAELRPYQTSLSVRTGSEREAERFRAALEQASMRAAAHWQFDMSERIDGEAHGATVMVPIEFRIVERGAPTRPGSWHTLVPGPVHAVPWQQQDERLAIDVSTLGHGEAMAVNSRFRLLDEAGISH